VRNKIKKRTFPESDFMLVFLMRFLIRCKDEERMLRG
jgi:hypothetical protein